MDEGKNKIMETGEKFKDVGQTIQGIGCGLTLLITVPILIGIFFGPVGIIIGIIIGILGLSALFTGKK